MNEADNPSNSSTPLLKEEKRRQNSVYQRMIKSGDDDGDISSNHNHRAERRSQTNTMSSIAPESQSCFTINTFLFFLICFQLINNLMLAYTDSVINFIAKRFHISNTMVSLLPSAYQAGSMIVVVPASYYGSKFNRPKGMALGVLFMVIGLGLCVIPHFVLPVPKILNATLSEFCLPSRNISMSLANTLCNAKSSFHNPVVVLIVGKFIKF